MPYAWDPAGYPTYLAEDTYLRPVVPSGSPHHSPFPSPHGSPNTTPMYLDENYNYYQPGTGYIGVPMVPAGFVPLPPSPSMLSATFVPLPPSPRVSPRHGPIPLSPGAYPGYYPQQQQQQQYAHPFDPYYFPQSGQMYMNPAHKPRTSVHPMLKDAQYVHLDLSSPAYAPLTPSGSGGWNLEKKLVPIHDGYLSQIASHPAVSKIVITCSAFGAFEGSWAVAVDPGRTVSVGDVLRAVHRALQTPVTHAEWARLSEREVYEASKAYTHRCRKAEFEKMQGVRRVDLLGGKSWFGGISKVKDDDPHNFKLLVRSK